MTNLANLPPSRKTLIIKFFSKEEEVWPIIEEHLEVALSFAALGALVRHLKDKDVRLDPIMKPEAESEVLISTLRKAMKRLGDLAHKVRHSEGKTRREVVRPSENQAVAKLKTEMSNVFFRLAKEDTAVAESRQREDYEVEKISKVGESVVLEEQRGGNERKRMSMFRVNAQNRFDKPSSSVYRSMPSQVSSCNNCRRKDRSIMDLKETLHEKEFFMEATIEDANLQRQEKTELDAELISAKAAFADLRKRLAQEVEEREADFRRYVEEVSSLREKLRGAVVELELALEEVSSLKKQLASIARASRRGEALNKKLRRRMSELQDSREEILSRRDRVVSEEIPAARRRRTFQEKRRSRNIFEERYQIGDPATNNQIDNSAGKRGAIAGFEKLQSKEIERMRSAYEQQIKELKIQVKYFQEKVRVQESSISQRINDEEQKLTESGKYKEITISSSFEKVTEGSELNNTRHLRDSEMEKWKKLYMAAKVTIDLLQSHLHNNVSSSRISPQAYSPSSSSDLVHHTQRAQNWLRIVKGQQETKWEQIALERQTRAKDERLEALRQQLLRMEKEATQNQEEIKMLKDKLRLA